MKCLRRDCDAETTLPLPESWVLQVDGAICPVHAKNMRVKDSTLDGHGIPTTKPDWVKDFEAKGKEGERGN